jgi:hypothetical protein
VNLSISSTYTAQMVDGAGVTTNSDQTKE